LPVFICDAKLLILLNSILLNTLKLLYNPIPFYIYPLNPNFFITSGLDTFTSAATELVLGADSPAIKENRVS